MKDFKILKNRDRRMKTFLLNFGPQHPAAHGILKIALQLSGEVIVRSDPSFGLLHRGTEKLIENKFFIQSIPYLDRMDYVANLFQEHAFVSSIESLFSFKLKTDILLIRIVFDELSRVLNHLLTVSAICLDMGSMGPIFWAFEEREQIMEIMERVSGARMHTALYRPFSFSNNFFYKNLVNDILLLVTKGSRFINGSFISLLNNKTLKSRLTRVGVFSLKKISNYGITGIIGRSSGLAIDARIQNISHYSRGYSFTALSSFVSVGGDSFDRFICRSKEIIESLRLIVVILNLKSFSSFENKKKNMSMEDIINFFKFQMFIKTKKSSMSVGLVESPKGLFASTIVNSSSYVPYRSQFRSPVAFNMNLIPSFSNNINFADFVATFCSLDVVLGEIDR